MPHSPSLAHHAPDQSSVRLFLCDVRAYSLPFARCSPAHPPSRVLASPATATDLDYSRLEGVVSRWLAQRLACWPHCFPLHVRSG